MQANISKIRKQNLLLVGPYPPPFGGISNHLHELNIGLEKTAYESHVLDFCSSSEDFTKHGAKIFRRVASLRLRHLQILCTSYRKLAKILLLLSLNVLRSPRLYLGSLIKALIVVEMIDKNKINKTIIYETKKGALIPFVKILRPKNSLFYCIFADPYKYPDYYKKHKSWFKRSVEATTKVFATSCYCADAYGNFTKTADPSVIYVGVDLERFHEMDPSEAREKISISDRPTILFLGRMVAEMGAYNALEIAEIILSKDLDINFVIAGAEGDLTDEIKRRAEKYDGRLIVKTNIPMDDLPNYYGASTICIAPTLGVQACMGVSIKEAMASGRPIIASDSGGIPEAIRHYEEGCIVPLQNGGIDNDIFAQQIVDLLNMPEMVKLLGKNARVRCASVFSFNASIKKYLELLAS